LKVLTTFPGWWGTIYQTAWSDKAFNP